MEIRNKHLVLVFWNLGIGGIQTRMKDVVEKLAKQGMQITILVDKRMDKEIVLPQSSLIDIISFRDERYQELNRPFKRLERFRFPWWLYVQLRQLQPTTVLAFLNRFSVYCVLVRYFLRMRGRDFKLVLNEGILTSKYLKQYERFYWKYLVAIFYKNADAIIVPTQAVKNDLVKNFAVPNKIVNLVPSWVPRVLDKIISKTKKYDGIYVGRLSPEKGIEMLVNLAIMVKEKKLSFRIAIVGDGVMAGWLSEIIGKKKLDKVIDFVGFKTHVETLFLISQSRLFLLPSTNEGLPMTVLEANALGVAAAVMPFAGAEEIIFNGKTGLILTEMNYCQKVLELWKKRPGLEKMGEKAKKYVIKNHSERNLDNFIRVVGATK